MVASNVARGNWKPCGALQSTTWDWGANCLLTSRACADCETARLRNGQQRAAGITLLLSHGRATLLSHTWGPSAMVAGKHTRRACCDALASWPSSHTTQNRRHGCTRACTLLTNTWARMFDVPEDAAGLARLWGALSLTPCLFRRATHATCFVPHTVDHTERRAGSPNPNGTATAGEHSRARRPSPSNTSHK